MIAEGWKEIDRIFRVSLKEKPEDEGADSVKELSFEEGQTFENVPASVTEHFTSPPKAYTEDTLLAAMERAGAEEMPGDAERKGLGTPATRASIIEKLVSGGFVERKGKSLVPTHAGMNLIAVLPEVLTSPMLTAEWEQKLNQIAKGEASADTFMADISAMASELVQTYSCISEEGQKKGDETLDYRFEPLDSIHRNGLTVKAENYELVYQASLAAGEGLEDIFTRFNMERPADFTGHSLSVSDIVVLHENGRDTAHYCDRVGFSQVPEFFKSEPIVPDDLMTGERISTLRGSFALTEMTRQQIEAAGYGFHHQSDDGKYLIMGNGTHAFAIRNEDDNPMRTAEMTLEDDYGMIDGVINNGRRGEELEKVKEAAAKSEPERKPSIMDRLADAKKECAERKPADRPAPTKKPPELGEL